MLTTTPDRTLLDGLRAGCADAYREAFHRHHRAMLAAAGRHAPQALAEEAVQDAWAAVTRGGADVRGSSLRAWLCGIARHKAIDAVRRDALQGGPARASAEPLELPAPESEAPQAIAEARAAVRDVAAAIRRLPPGDRRVLRARAVGTTADAAAILGISDGAARVRVHRARARLEADLVGRGTW